MLNQLAIKLAFCFLLLASNSFSQKSNIITVIYDTIALDDGKIIIGKNDSGLKLLSDCKCITHNSDEFLSFVQYDTNGNINKYLSSILYDINPKLPIVGDTVKIRFNIYGVEDLKTYRSAFAMRVLPDTTQAFYQKTKMVESQSGMLKFVPNLKGKYKVRMGVVSTTPRLSISDCYFYVDINE